MSCFSWILIIYSILFFTTIVAFQRWMASSKTLHFASQCLFNYYRVVKWRLETWLFVYINMNIFSIGITTFGYIFEILWIQFLIYTIISRKRYIFAISIRKTSYYGYIILQRIREGISNISYYKTLYKWIYVFEHFEMSY